MADPTPTTPLTGTVCPWCSAAVTPETVICPSCAAVLISDEEPALPGVTEVDAKILRGEKPPPPRNRLLSWISGDYPDQASSPADAQAVAPPDPEVQREIRRLEYEAEVASLQAEADALLSEAVVEGRVVEVPDGIRPFELDPAAEGETAATVSDEVAPTRRPPTRRPRTRPLPTRPPRLRPLRTPRSRTQAPPARPLRTAAAPPNAAVEKPEPRLTGSGHYPAPVPDRLPSTRSVVPARASRPHRRPDLPRRHVPAVRRARRLVAGRPVGRRRGRASSASATSRPMPDRHRTRPSAGWAPRSAARCPA